MIKEDDLEEFDLEKMLSEIEETPRIIKIWWRIESFIKDYFSPKSIKNNFKWLYQRIKRGFDDTELWNLDDSFYKWFYPRLKAFSEKELMGYPEEYGSVENWKNILKKRVYQLEQIIFYEFVNSDFKDGAKYLSEEELETIKEESFSNENDYNRRVSIKGYDKMYKEFMEWFAKDCGNLWD